MIHHKQYIKYQTGGFIPLKLNFLYQSKEPGIQDELSVYKYMNWMYLWRPKSYKTYNLQG